VACYFPPIKTRAIKKPLFPPPNPTGTRREIMPFLPVVSPVYGVVSRISRNTITVYISKDDKHTVYSPISGKITNIASYDGSWYRKVFTANVNKTSRVTVYLQNDNIKDRQVSFWLEVGKPKYITNRIRMDFEKGSKVSKGLAIGEIILGSLSRMRFGGLEHKNMVDVGDVVIGGETVLAQVRC
jgi:phosphatidylserine decarboxylase